MGSFDEEEGTCRLVGLFPDSDRLVVRTGHDKVAAVTDGKSPDLTRVSSELLDALELQRPRRGRVIRVSASLAREALPSRNTHLVSIPVLEHPIFRNGPEAVRALFERDAHDGLLVSKERAVAVTKVQPPDLDVLVGRAGDDELRVFGDVEG